VHIYSIQTHTQHTHTHTHAVYTHTHTHMQYTHTQLLIICVLQETMFSLPLLIISAPVEIIKSTLVYVLLADNTHPPSMGNVLFKLWCTFLSNIQIT